MRERKVRFWPAKSVNVSTALVFRSVNIIALVSGIVPDFFLGSGLTAASGATKSCGLQIKYTRHCYAHLLDLPVNCIRPVFSLPSLSSLLHYKHHMRRAADSDCYSSVKSCAHSG